MKKALCIVLGMIMLISALNILTVSAEETDSETPEVPQVKIVTNDGVGLSLKKEDGYVGATVTIVDTDGTEISGAADVKIRGNSTSRLNKKSYTIKLAKKANVLGMGKAKKWALVANMFDPTLLRNYVSFHTAAELGIPYTSEIKVAEVWMDGSFRGCYSFIEPVQAGETRVDIDVDSNGGMNDFLIEREHNRVEEGAVYFKTNGIRFVCSDPDKPNQEQLDYIQSTMNRLVETMKNGNRAQIEDCIDLDSFAKYYVLNEFVKAVDFDYSSVYFYYKDGKLYAGPPWDYDLALGNEDAAASANYEASNQTDGLHCNTKHFYKWLCQYPWFFDLVRKVYTEHSAFLDDIGAENGFIDSAAQEFSAPIERNFSKSGANWNQTAYYQNLNRKPDSTYSENLEYFMNWTSQRALWLNSYFTQDVTAYTLGDSDSDDVVSILDATVIQRQLASVPVKSCDSISADADGDGSMSIIDATIIRRWLVYFSITDPVGEVLWRKNQA